MFLKFGWLNLDSKPASWELCNRWSEGEYGHEQDDLLSEVRDRCLWTVRCTTHDE